MASRETIRETGEQRHTARARADREQSLAEQQRASEHAAATRDAERLEVVNVFEWTVGKLRSVAVGGDGAVAAAGGNDGDIVVWDLDL